MNKIIYIAIGILLAVGLTARAATVLFPYQGGTGTSTPPSAGQVLIGSAGGVYNATSTLYVKTNGNVGIGTNNPQYALDVNGSVGLSRIYSNAGSGDNIDFDSSYAYLNGLGIYAMGNSILGVGTLTTTGNVGIGTTSPGNKLSVYNGAIDIQPSILGTLNDKFLKVLNYQGNERMSFGYDNSNIRLYINNQSGTPLMAVEGSTGNVGIGTTSPASGLHVNNLGSGSPTALASAVSSGLVLGDSSTNAIINMGVNGGSATWLQARQKQGGASALDIAIQPLGGNVGIGTTSPSAKLSVKGGGTTTGRAFVISDSANTEKFTVLDNGNVGIGTANPGAKLHLYGSAYTGAIFQDTTAVAFGYNQFIGPAGNSYQYWFGNTYSSAVNRYVTSSFLVDVTTSGGLGLAASNASGNIRFYTGGDNERLRIDTQGNVGLSTTSPYAKLSISGNSYSSSYTPVLFAISSSTEGTATTTVFSVSAEGFGTTTVSGLNISAQATSTSNVGFNITSGCYAINNTCISGGGTGTGLTSYDAWTHPAAGQSATTSLMLFNGNASTTRISATQAFFGGTATSTFTSDGSLGIGTTSTWAKLAINPVAGDGNSFVIGSSTATSFIVTNSGKVGIGLTNPGSYHLYVRGAGYFSSSLNVSNTITGNAFKGSVSGTAAAPTYSLNTDTNTGMFIPSGDIIGFSTSGIERMRIDPSGNIGIGTTSPASKLHVDNVPLGNGTVATTTVDFGDYATTTSHACFNTKNTVGENISFYFVGTSMVVESNRCR